MSNISVIDSCCCVPFFNDYVIESVIMKNGSDDRNGEAIMMLSRGNERYEMNIELKEGKKEGVCKIMREDGTLFMKVMFVNDVCEGELIKKNEYGKTVLKGRLERGIEVGLWIEYDDRGVEIWRGFYRNGKQFSAVMESEKKDGICFDFEEGRIVRECEYKNGRSIGVLREWKGDVMIEYDDNGKRVYEGGWKGDMKRGYVREGKGREYEGDGKRTLYYGDWKNGLREGYGSEFKDYCSVYTGEWKNGMRDGEGEEYNENEELIRSGIWTKGEYGVIKQFEDGYGNGLSVFDTSYLERVTKLVIGSDCLNRVNRFVIDGLNELESIKIGRNNFKLSENRRKGSFCSITNCDQLRNLEIGDRSFHWYKVFELKNLPSLISVHVGNHVLTWCHSVVFESENDE